MPEHAINSGDRPMELQMAAVVYRPVEGLLMFTNSQHAPTIRTIVKMAKKIKPPVL